jgi:hypothetical protein
MSDWQTCAVCGEVGAEEAKGHTAEGVPISGLPDGWVTFAGYPQLIVDIPWEGDCLLPFEVVDAIRSFDGLVRLERLGPEVTVAAVREVDTMYLGTVCPLCFAERKWDTDQWVWHLATATEPPADEPTAGEPPS